MNKQKQKSKMISSLLQDLFSWSTKTSSLNPDNMITNKVVTSKLDMPVFELGRFMLNMDYTINYYPLHV
jgi:hypothetical protein